MKIAVFASTNASDLPAVFESIQAGILKGKCKILTGVVNDQKAGAIDKFNTYGIPFLLVSTKTDKENIYNNINEYLVEMGIDLIICIGWMSIIPKTFVKKWAKKILNVHPSILPNFPGKNAIDDTIKAGVNTTGCTVHYIDEGIDTGEIIMQKELMISKDDNFDTLKKKIQRAEQEIYPEAILKIISI